MALLFALVVAVPGIVFGLVGIAYLGAYLRMVRTEPTDVAAVSEDMDVVELDGTARPVDDPLSSELANADTLMCSWKISEIRKTARSTDDGHTEGTRETKVTLESDVEVDPFVLDDGTGEMLVDPRGAEWVLEDEYAYRTDEDTPPQPSIRSFLDDIGWTPNVEKTGSVKPRIYEEKRLDPGDDVYVYGPVKPGPADNTADRVVSPHIRTDNAEEVGTLERTSMRLSPDLLPFVGDSANTFALGGADESGLFTIADSSESDAQRRYLKRGGMIVGVAVFFLGVSGIIFVA